MRRDERLERVRTLASRLLDGTATAEERADLNGLLRGDPEACETYLGFVEIDAWLGREVAAGIEAAAEILPFGGPSLRRPPRIRPTGRVPLYALVAALAVLLALAGLLWKAEDHPGELSHAPGVAVLSRVVDPEWPEGASTPSTGETVPTGTFRLRSGLAQIEFFSGATVIVEGPAELELESAWRARCRSGRVRVFVPEPAQGFTLLTPDYTAVDLGTEFALSVDSEGRSEVHVVDGAVRLEATDGRALRQIDAGEAVRGENGALTEIESRGEAFVGRERLLELARDDWRSRYAAWKRHNEGLRRDPAMLVAFDFEDQDPWDRALVNRAESAPAAGAVIGAQWTQGRWPGKGALEFKRINDRVRLRVPGDHPAMTLAAWVRVEGFERWLNSLILTDGWEKGEVHWQISDRGQLILGVSGGPNCFSEPVIQPSDLGRWMHLAVTIDGSAGTGRIVHYLDGRPVGETVSAKPLPPLRLGDAEIGNWQPADLTSNPTPIRSLNGRIDDFLILGRALAADEIAELHRAGLPNG